MNKGLILAGMFLVMCAGVPPGIAETLEEQKARAEDGNAQAQIELGAIAARLQEDPRILWFRVTAINEESIHNHGAFARVERRCG